MPRLRRPSAYLPAMPSVCRQQFQRLKPEAGGFTANFIFALHDHDGEHRPLGADHQGVVQVKRRVARLPSRSVRAQSRIPRPRRG